MNGSLVSMGPILPERSNHCGQTPYKQKRANEEVILVKARLPDPVVLVVTFSWRKRLANVSLKLPYLMNFTIV